MVQVLSIDSSVPAGSVALFNNSLVLSALTFNKNIPSSKSILASINQLLSESPYELASVDVFAITTGPGSFTGLRVGISLVKGLVLGTEKPFLAVDTLEAIAGLAQPCEYQICPVLDARKKEVYAAFFEFQGNHLNRLSPNMAICPKELANGIDRPTLFVGQGVKVYETLWKEKLGRLFLENKGIIRDEPVATSAGRLAIESLETKQDNNLDNLKINYIRKSEAEIKLGH